MAGLFNRIRRFLAGDVPPVATTGRRVYAAAQASRLTADWFTSILSADQEIKGDARRLRGSARALVRDNSFAARYLKMLEENVVGTDDCGIRLQARNKTTRGDVAESLNDQLETAWEAWGAPETASIDGRLSWADIQALAMRSVAQDGEALIRIIRGAPNAYGFALQVLDIDLLDDLYSAEATVAPNGNQIRFGVELDGYGRPVAYWLWTSHPSEYFNTPLTRTRTRVPAEDIIHLYRVDRPGQTRGVTWFAPVMLDQKMLQGYQEAEITAARIGASNMAAVVIDADKAGVSLPDESPGATALPAEVEGGLLMRLGPGESLISTDFNHPSTAFGPFTKEIKRSIATGLNVAYPSLTGDLEAVNYSSIRAGLITERDFYRRLQTWLATNLHRRVFREWVKYAALFAHIPAREVGAMSDVTWEPRGWKWVDPKNDLEAASLAIALGLTSRHALCAEHGSDFEENLEDLADEQKQADEAGVSVTPLTITVKGEAPNDDPSGDNTVTTTGGADAGGRAGPLHLTRGIR